MDGPDVIERELILPVPRARVWAALTQPVGLAAWFGTAATVDLRPGGAVTFVWDSSGVVHTNTAVIEVVEPLQRFAFRWHPYDGERATSAPGPTTLVEFTLADHPDGTRLRLVESGFASIPPEFHAGNTRGWDAELGDLVAYLVPAAADRC